MCAYARRSIDQNVGTAVEQAMHVQVEKLWKFAS